MAGLWDRLTSPTREVSRVPAHLVKAGMYLAVRGVFTLAQLQAGMNNAMGTPLRAEDNADLSAILANASSGTALAKLDYLERMDAVNIAAEMRALTNEATWRSELGIA